VPQTARQSREVRRRALALTNPAQGREVRRRGPPRKRTPSFGMEVTEAEVGRSRKKREAQADPTFFGRPAEPEPSGEGPANGNRPGSQDLGRNPAGVSEELAPTKFRPARE
jgi:hypothetical protein